MIPIPLQNSSAAAYLEVEGSEVEFRQESGPGGRPVAYVILGGAMGQLGEVEVGLADGLNVLTEDEYKKSIIKLEDDSIITSATVEFPAVTDDATQAYQRTVDNTTAYSVDIDNGGLIVYTLEPGTSKILVFDSAGVRISDSGSASNLIGTYAARPIAGSAGRVYYATTSVYPFMDDGTQWRPIIRAAKFGWEITSIASFTEYRQSGLPAASISVGSGALSFTYVSAGNPLDVRFISKTMPGGAFRVEVFTRFAALGQSGGGATIMGVGFRSSTTGAVEFVQLQTPELGASGVISQFKRFRATAGNLTTTPVYTFDSSVDAIFANVVGTGVNGADGVWIAAISDGAGARSYEFSLDGFNWLPIANLGSVGNAFLTADEWCFCSWTSSITASVQLQGAYVYSIKENP